MGLGGCTSSMRAAMAGALLCIHRNRNTGQYRLAAHRSSLGAARMWVIPESAAWGGGFFFSSFLKLIGTML